MPPPTTVRLVPFAPTETVPIVLMMPAPAAPPRVVTMVGAVFATEITKLVTLNVPAVSFVGARMRVEAVPPLIVIVCAAVPRAERLPSWSVPDVSVWALATLRVDVELSRSVPKPVLLVMKFPPMAPKMRVVFAPTLKVAVLALRVTAPKVSCAVLASVPVMLEPLLTSRVAAGIARVPRVKLADSAPLVEPTTIEALFVPVRVVL